MPTIRTTHAPGRDLEVTEQEALDLARWGVLVDTPPASEVTEPAGGPAGKPGRKARTRTPGPQG